MEERGYKFAVSYTSRQPRNDETDGKDYHFLSLDDFEKKIKEGFFYEHAFYAGNYYGQGLKEWNEYDIFVMEPSGINNIKPEDRKNSFVMFINTDERIRVERMKQRGSDIKIIEERIKKDRELFKDFFNYDMIINENF